MIIYIIGDLDKKIIMNKENKKARKEIKKLTKSWDFRFYYFLDSIYLKMRLFFKKIK